METEQKLVAKIEVKGTLCEESSFFAAKTCPEASQKYKTEDLNLRSFRN